jgi:prepilin-type N-terminal cleavage/methylation domain-containing protein
MATRIDRRGHRRRPPPGGFTLLEALVAVALLAMAASVLAPLAADWQQQRQRRAVLADLVLLRQGLVRRAAEAGRYPGWGELDLETLAPLAPAQLADPAAVLERLAGHRLEAYLPWDPFRPGSGPPLGPEATSFCVIATPAFAPTTRIVITERDAYLHTPAGLERL